MTRNISKLVVIMFSKIISNYTLQRYLNYLRVTWEVQYITFSTSSIMSIDKVESFLSLLQHCLYHFEKDGVNIKKEKKEISDI